MAGRPRPRGSTGGGRAVGHAEFLGTGRLFPGRAPLARTHVGRHGVVSFGSARARLAGGGRAILSDHGFRVWVAVRAASAGVVSAAWRSARRDRCTVEVL